MVNNSWKTVTLSQIGTFRKGSGISRAESNTGTLPAVRYGELYTVHNNYVCTYTSHISREVASKSLRVYYGDILFACSGETKEDIAKCAAIIDDSEAYAGGDIIVLSLTTEVDPIFLGFILNTQNVIQQRAQKAQGDAIVHISTDSIKSIEITLPRYEEQVRIAEALSDIDKRIATAITDSCGDIFVLLRLAEAFSEKSMKNKSPKDYYISCQYTPVVNF